MRINIKTKDGVESSIDVVALVQSISPDIKVTCEENGDVDIKNIVNGHKYHLCFNIVGASPYIDNKDEVVRLIEDFVQFIAFGDIEDAPKQD